jgi:hypothetical protein
VSVSDRFPDRLGDVDHKIGTSLLEIGCRTYLPDTQTHIVETAVALGVAEVEDRADDLPPTGRVGTS